MGPDSSEPADDSRSLGALLREKSQVWPSQPDAGAAPSLQPRGDATNPGWMSSGAADNKVPFSDHLEWTKQTSLNGCDLHHQDTVKKQCNAAAGTSVGPVPITREAQPTRTAQHPATPQLAKPAVLARPASASSSSPGLTFAKPVQASPRASPATPASASPAAVLPRHSRGLDFSRAATQLHHSMIADTSPATSPVIATRGMAIPAARVSRYDSSVSRSPGGTPIGLPALDRAMPGMPSSLGSLQMLDGLSTSSSDDDRDEYDESDEGDAQDGAPLSRRCTEEFRGDEMMASTPDATVSRHPKPMQTTQADSSSSSITPLLSPETAAPSQSANGQQSLPEPSLGSASQSGGFGGLSAPINITTAIPSTKPSFKYYQRNRTRNGKGRHAHHQGYYQQSPRLGALSSLVPKVVRSIETSGPLDAPRLSNATGATGNEMLYSDMSEDDVIGKPAGVHRDGASPAMQTRPDSTRAGVHRKAITRPRNLLPKPKPFNRIRAQLLEETAPVEFDVRREAEVIRQVRDSEVDPQLANTAEGIQSHVHLQDSDMCWESPHADDSTGDGAGPPSGFPRPLTTFSLHSSAAPVTTPTTATSTGTGMFQFPRYETPPPPSSRHSSDMLMDTDTPPPFSLSGMPPRPSTQAVDEAPGGWAASIAAAQESLLVTAGSSTTSPATAGPPPLPPASTTKRRRDDFIDFNTFKRRAVSPSVSVVSTQSSPQVKPLKRPGSLSSESGNNSFGSNGVGGPLKRVGLQGMKEASDGFRDMKID